MSVIAGCTSLIDYLERFKFPCSLLHIREALYLCTYELLEELYDQGLRYAEIRFAPQKSRAEQLTQYEATEIVLRAMHDVPLPCGLILSMMRGDDNHDQNLETVEVARQFAKQGVVAVDLAGAESLYPTHTFSEEFAAVHRAGIPLINGGITGFYGTCYFYVPGKTPSLEQAGLLAPPKEKPKSVSSTAGIIGALMAEIAGRYFLNDSPPAGRLLVYDGCSLSGLTLKGGFYDET